MSILRRSTTRRCCVAIINIVTSRHLSMNDVDLTNQVNKILAVGASDKSLLDDCLGIPELYLIV